MQRRLLQQDTGDASCTERGRRCGFRRTGTCWKFIRVHMTDFLEKRSIIHSLAKLQASRQLPRSAAQAEADIKFGYCTEFIILLDKPMTEETEHEFKKFLMSIGDSIVLVADDEIVKVHVHTNDPGLAIQKALDVWCTYPV